MSGNPDYETVLKAISAWPPEQRMALAHDVLETVRHDAQTTSAPKQTLQRALGLGRGDAQPPNDREVAGWVDEHLSEKYGK
ncbi:MAG: hypothetical protein JWP03_4948 [Phycisphaerales bacterium]|nr:hypothetical protein [Phycisphaerales bacterium]